jgi:3-hydroxybutyryl-CoA dehydrogenase
MAIETIMVIGAGVMGRGIAEVAANSGFRVLWNDIKPELVERGLAEIKKSLNRRLEKQKITAVDHQKSLDILNQNVSVAEGLGRAADADFVIEAVTEDLTLKQQLHVAIGPQCREETVVATNTATFSITALGNSSGRPDRFIGTHFFVPPPVMRLVEVTRGILTSEETCRTTQEVLTRMGKTAVPSPDIPGFIVNRVMFPLINEAIRLVELGVKPADVDQAMRLGANYPMGPLELADYAGLDAELLAMDSVYAATGDLKFKPCVLLRNMVAAGLLGRKTGRGFYDYSKK